MGSKEFVLLGEAFTADIPQQIDLIDIDDISVVV